jgi:hypothetical protein
MCKIVHLHLLHFQDFQYLIFFAQDRINIDALEVNANVTFASLSEASQVHSYCALMLLHTEEPFCGVLSSQRGFFNLFALCYVRFDINANVHAQTEEDNLKKKYSTIDVNW